MWMSDIERDTQLIRDLCAWLDKKPSRVAKEIGAAATTMTRVFNGEATSVLSRATVNKLREQYPAFPGWRPSSGKPLNLRDAPDLPATVSADDGVAEITALDLSVSMGPGTLIDGFLESEPVKMDINVLRAVTRTPFDMLRIIKGTGDSMEPTLRTNDRVLVDTSERTMSRLHGVYWIDYEGAHGLKRLRPAGKGRIKIISDNTDAGDTFEVDADEIRIHGRALLFWRDL